MLALLLALFCAAPTCDPACAPGQSCARIESCDPDSCTASFVCEGTPDDCRTNGCDTDHHECRWITGNEYGCLEKACSSRPSWSEHLAWRCVEWSSTKDDCCHEWRYGSEDP